MFCVCEMRVCSQQLISALCLWEQGWLAAINQCFVSVEIGTACSNCLVLCACDIGHSVQQLISALCL